ncbi:MAG: gamma carbonic anhydrase family protein [Gammaproteobacteria bacterium]|jgi:carbonic anhydrase/acetyltransferase-like protein (isoleucine patch superfamily)
MIFQIDKHKPKFNDTNFIAPNATVIGQVTLEEDASVWFNVVIRGDNDPIIIGKKSNIQDGSILHTDLGAPLNIGEGVTVGHKVMLHGCTISENCLIGINTTILNHAVIGKNSIVGANSLITEGKEYPENTLIMGSPAKSIRQLREAEIMMINMSSEAYVENGKRFMKSLSSV